MRLNTTTVPRLRTLRLAQLVTQVDLAKSAGVHVSLIKRAEKGYPARFATVHKLATALGVAPHALIEEVSRANDPPAA